MSERFLESNGMLILKKYSHALKASLLMSETRLEPTRPKGASSSCWTRFTAARSKSSSHVVFLPAGIRFSYRVGHNVDRPRRLQ